MDEQAVPSISSGSVGSRFVSQAEIDEAKANKEAAWKAAYARLGQEPPPQPVDDSYDGRSLYERLQEQKTAKQEEWDEKMKFSNQFRGLEEEEILFLNSVQGQQKQEERERKLQDDEEVKSFKVAQKNSDSTQVAASKSTAASKPSTGKPSQPLPPGKKGTRSLLKGVVKKKAKPKPDNETGKHGNKLGEPPAAEAKSTSIKQPPGQSLDENSKKRLAAADESATESKRHKTGDSPS